MVLTMFRRGQSKNAPRKRKFEAKKSKATKPKPAKTKDASDDEILSEDEELDEQVEVPVQAPRFEEDDEDNDYETPAQKKLRLAKKYLSELREEEEDDEGVTQRLRDEYLEEHGRLQRNVAEALEPSDQVVVMKHRFQKFPLTCACFGAGGVFTGCKNEIVLKWQIEGFKVLGKIDLKKGNPEARGLRHTQAMALNERFLAIADSSHDIQVYCPKTLTKLGLLQGHRGSVTALVFRKGSSQLYTASADRSIRIWSLDEMTFVEALFGHQTTVTGIDALARERAISSGGSDRSIRVWKIVEESQLVYQDGHGGSIEDVKLVNEEHFVSCGDDGQICSWSVAKKRPLGSVKLAHGSQSSGEPNWISAIGVLLNSDVMASGSCDGFVRVWQLANNFSKILPLFALPVTGFVNQLQFVGDSKDDRVKVAACVGQEHRLGRWWRIPEAKNCLHIFQLEKKSN